MKYEDAPYECEIFIIRYVPFSRDEEFGEPPIEVKIVACVSGDVATKVNQWAKEKYHKIIYWEKPALKVGFIELIL